jgi:hypothetical protein
MSPASFLHRAQELLAGASVTLRWQEGEEATRSLDGSWSLGAARSFLDRTKLAAVLNPDAEEFGRSKHQHRQLARECDDFCGHCELNGLPETHVIGEDETRLAKRVQITNNAGDERTLVLRKADPLARSGSLDERRLLLAPRVPFRYLHDTPPEDALDILDHHLSELARVAMAPQRIELRLHPGYRGGVLVLPQKLVMAAPGFAGLVSRAKKTGAAAATVANDAGLAVNETEEKICATGAAVRSNPAA